MICLFIFSYINFSQICAQVVRRCLKPDLRTQAVVRDETIIKTTKWENGKIVKTGRPIVLCIHEHKHIVIFKTTTIFFTNFLSIYSGTIINELFKY